MKLLLLICMAIFISLPAQTTADGGISVESITARDIAFTPREAINPVCFNGSGELLPCGTGITPPPGETIYLEGTWTGRMVYDKNIPEPNNCHDADLRMATPCKLGSFCETRIDNMLESISIYPDSGGLDIVQPGIRFQSWTVTGNNYFLSIMTSYTITFYPTGVADGSWTEFPNGNCYGTWSFIKD